MTFDKAICDAAEHLTKGADLHELREAVQDLRTLAPDSVLAQLVEEKIERLERAADEGGCTRRS